MSTNDSFLEDAVGTLFLTPSELELFKEIDDHDKNFYLPEEAGTENVGTVRPVVTDEDLTNTHHLLKLNDYGEISFPDDEREPGHYHFSELDSPEIKHFSEFTHYDDLDDTYPTRELLKIKVIKNGEEHLNMIKDTITELSERGLGDIEIAILLNEAAENLH